VLALILALSMFSLAALAADDSISVFLDGQPLTFGDVEPQIINGSTMVPLRAVFEAFGAEVDWNNATQTVTATKGDTVVVLTVGVSSPTINGQVKTLNQPAVNISGRILAPLRFVGEAFGGQVDWTDATRTVTIASVPGSIPAPPPGGSSAETGLKGVLAGLPGAEAKAALWKSLTGFWNRPSITGTCVQINTYENNPFFAIFAWDSEGDPGGTLTDASLVSGNIVSLTVHYDVVEADGELYTEDIPARDVVYQIDMTGIIEGKDSFRLKMVTYNVDWMDFVYAGATFDEAYSHYGKLFYGIG